MSHSFFRPANFAWFTVYLLLIGSLGWAMAYARAQAFELYGSLEAKEDWEEWVQDAQRSSEGDGPVQRRVPQASAPPAYLLMRDHFASCLLIALLLTSALFFTAMVFIRGVWNTGLEGGVPGVDPRAHSDSSDRGRLN